jgi:hypothetical protein
MKKRQLLCVLSLLTVVRLFAQATAQPKLDATQAKDLAELMCRQLPNVGTILETIRIDAPGGPPAPPPQEPMVTDDVYDALLQLGPYSVNCLTDELLNSRWMPDPRAEPLLGAPMVGDVAYMILADKGVPDVLPRLAHKQPNELRMDEYFIWPSVGDHRRRLQNAVREWLIKHPDCCGTIPVVRSTEPTTWKFRMSDFDLEQAQSKFSRLRLGMNPGQVLKITGNPDAIDRSGDDNPDHWHVALLGMCANDHNENLAYIYFIERWADKIARRDPLRDRYLIAFFSAEGKLTRMFSNVAGIAPVLPPSDYGTWSRIAWGNGATH